MPKNVISEVGRPVSVVWFSYIIWVFFFFWNVSSGIKLIVAVDSNAPTSSRSVF